jgi:predicted nucleic acid-binding Zn ribbon protein
MVYSRALRSGMIDYDLLPNEIRLLLLLCDETLDEGVLIGRVNLEKWAARLRMREAKGLRVDKCAKVFKNLCDLLIVDLNGAQGTYQLRPYASDWSRTRALHRDKKTQDELSLCAERPLSESLSELSREKALLGVPEPAERNWHALFTEMNAAVQAGPEAVERFQQAHPGLFSAEKSADVRRKNPPTNSANSADAQNAQSFQVFAGVWPGVPSSAEKSAESAKPASPVHTRAQAVASLASDVQKAELAKASSDKSAEALEWVRSVDRMGQLADPVYGPQWETLCLKYPTYVLGRLKRRFEMSEQDEPGKLSDPLAYLSRKAREEGRMTR